MTEITIQVTAQDIARGVRADVCRCPIALAMKRAGIINPVAGLTRLMTKDDDGEVVRRWTTPGNVQDWMVGFDQHQSVAPFTFTLEEAE